MHRKCENSIMFVFILWIFQKYPFLLSYIYKGPSSAIGKIIFLSYCRALRKSNSIPVHLTVSSNNEVSLPPSLRPQNSTSAAKLVNSGHQTGLDLHEPDCATYKKWASAQTLPNSSNTSHISRRAPPGTPTGETCSSLQKKKFR